MLPAFLREHLLCWDGQNNPMPVALVKTRASVMSRGPGVCQSAGGFFLFFCFLYGTVAVLDK